MSKLLSTLLDRYLGLTASTASQIFREYHEEVGLTITVGKPFRTFSYISSDGNRHTVEITYLCHSDTDEEIQLSSAHTEYAWITKMEVDAYKISNEMKTSIREGFEQV